MRRVGANTGVKVDVRIVAATNQNLMANIESGEFREDLYYHLQVIVLHLPPLREREEEILPIATHYLQNYAQKFRKPLQGFHRKPKVRWVLLARQHPRTHQRRRTRRNFIREDVVQTDDLGLRTENRSPNP